MRLFLASVVGRTIELFEKEFFSLKNKKIAFVANAADVYECKDFIYFDRKRLLDYGAKLIDVDLRIVNGKKLHAVLSDVDVIFVGGGNTFYLLEVMKKSGFDKMVKKLLDSGIVYVGSSAGSCVVAPNITPISALDEPEKAKSLKSYKALNLTRTLVLPHINNKRYGPICLEIKKKYEKKYDLELLRDNQVLIINERKRKIVSSRISFSLIKTYVDYKLRGKYFR